MKKTINVETNEIIERELNSQELAQQEIDESHILAERALKESEEISKTEQRQAILDRLGLTADEAKLLLG